MSMLRALFTAACCGTLLAAPCLAFEVEQFRNGMSRGQVKEALKSWNFDRVLDDSDAVLVAYDLAEKETDRRLVFYFCNDRLVGLQQQLRPSWKHFVTVANNYRHQYGPASRVEPELSVSSAGENASMAIWWRDRTELVGVRYLTLPREEQLAVMREVPNPCWNIPR